MLTPSYGVLFDTLLLTGTCLGGLSCMCRCAMPMRMPRRLTQRVRCMGCMGPHGLHRGACLGWATRDGYVPCMAWAAWEASFSHTLLRIRYCATYAYAYLPPQTVLVPCCSDAISRLILLRESQPNYFVLHAPHAGGPSWPGQDRCPHQAAEVGPSARPTGGDFHGRMGAWGHGRMWV